MLTESTQTNTTQHSEVVIRFAGDSGDGIQIIGMQFTNTTAAFGNDVQCLPDFPAEIRAPAGTTAGVSGFQVRFSQQVIHTSGDSAQVLVVMNPASLKANLADLREGGLLLINSDGFTPALLARAKYAADPREDGSLSRYQVVSVPMTEHTRLAVSEIGLKPSAVKKCKNLFALGVVLWLMHRSLTDCLQWIERKYQKDPQTIRANQLALQAGYACAENTDLLQERYQVAPASLKSGLYRQLSGNEAICLGLVTAAMMSGKDLFIAGYPITPASSILQTLIGYAEENNHIQALQAEDEIASICAAIGASFGGRLAATCSSGPGISLKIEAMGLAVMAELPLVVIDVQRAGPSTGMPTKTEQADLNLAIYGRHGECPLPVLAPASATDCFDLMIAACQIAMKWMTPVIVLSDAHLANSAEPWRIPDFSEDAYHDAVEISGGAYDRDPKTLARNWVIPGTRDKMYRLGGLEKDLRTGQISYDPQNHQRMVALRANKIQQLAEDAPIQNFIHGPGTGKCLVISWGSTYGAVLSAVERLQSEAKSISLIHLRQLSPLPSMLKVFCDGFETLIVPELNQGQLRQLLQQTLLRPIHGINKMQGKPFLESELYEQLCQYV